MFEAFVNPWSMLAGALLVSVPILIHLINRLRYKRVHWAAMEFLLKAQKKLKRKLIIQQLILLLLRCLLVLLLGLLVGRFLGFNPFQGRETRATIHTVILDDSPSMADPFTENGAESDAFTRAKRIVTEDIAKAAMAANNPQFMEVLRTSDLEALIQTDRLNTSSADTLKDKLQSLRPTPVRGSLVEALKKVKAAADKDSQDTVRVVHILGDFRAGDWEIDGPTIRIAIDTLTKQNVKVHLVDPVHPYRKEDKGAPVAHDNVGIVDLHPAKRSVALSEPAEFTLRVRNFGVAEVKDVVVAIAVNGDDNASQSLSVPAIAGGATEELRFSINFTALAPADKPLERFQLVSARTTSLDVKKDLALDNVRHTVVEVRPRLALLAIDGRPGDRDKKEGDSFYLRNLFTNVNKGYAWTPGTVKDLETRDLREFSAIYLLNVPALAEPQAKALEQYVRDGGGVGIFLGPDVKPTEFNTLLYADGKGILPAPLPDKPTDPMPEEKVFEKLFNFQKKILLPNRATARHEALRGLYFDDRGREDKENSQGTEKFFNFVLVKQYWPIKRVGKWRDDASVKELYCLPNDGAMGQYEPAAVAVQTKIPADEPKYAKFREALTKAKADLRRTASSTEPLFKLAVSLDRLLSDQISEGEADEALLREFWNLPEMSDLKNETMRLRDAVKFGDPLYLAKTLGRGRVTLVTTTAGERWNDWPAGPGGRSYPQVMTEMERYLGGSGSDEQPAVGVPYVLSLDPARYRPGVGRTRLTIDYLKEGDAAARSRQVEVTDLKEQVMTTAGGVSTLNFTDNAVPGAYLFTFTKVKAGANPSDAVESPEYAAAAFNVDAAREGDLRRASRDTILAEAPGAKLHSPADSAWLDELKNKRTDLTEAGWILLLLLAVLLAEQWMSSKLSYSSAGAVDSRVPSAAATFARAASMTSDAATPPQAKTEMTAA